MLMGRLPHLFALQVLVNLEATRTFREDGVQLSHALLEATEDVSEGRDDLGEFPSLCSDEIVSETCTLLNKDSELTNRDVIADALSKTKEETEKLWKILDLPDQTKCMDLCLALTKYIKASHVLPPRSDLACYTVGSRSFCDADLRATSLPSDMSEDEDLPNLHDEDKEDKAVSANPSKGIATTPWHFIERVANLFRIYPAEAPADDAGLGLMSDLDMAATAKKTEKIAQAFVSVALREFVHKKTGRQMKRWFGESDAAERTVLSTLNSIADVLANAWYYYPGHKCEDRYAYVERTGLDCSADELLRFGSRCATFNGKYVIYLCAGFFSKPEEQIAVLIHEASHQATAYTHDVCTERHLPARAKNCREAYGRKTCKALAKFSSKRALINADNYCYYVQDVVREVQPSSPQLRFSSTAEAQCPARSVLVGRHCRCLPHNHCEQNVARDCPFGLKRSKNEFLPSCEDCHCSADAWDIVAPAVPSKHFDQHPDCDGPCGSKVAGEQLEEDQCPQCDLAECTALQCPPHDVCKEFECPEFSSCRAQGLKPKCVCDFFFHEDGSGRCVPTIEKDFRCCTHKGESVWYQPKDLYERWFPFPKAICPKKPNIWKKASNCTDKVYGINYP